MILRDAQAVHCDKGVREHNCSGKILCGLECMYDKRGMSFSILGFISKICLYVSKITKYRSIW